MSLVRNSNLIFHFSIVPTFQYFNFPIFHPKRRISMKRTVMNRMMMGAFLCLVMFAQAQAQTDPLFVLERRTCQEGHRRAREDDYRKGQSAVRLRLAASLPSPVALSKVNRNTPILIRNRSRVKANGEEKEKYIEHKA